MLETFKSLFGVPLHHRNGKSGPTTIFTDHGELRAITPTPQEPAVNSTLSSTVLTPPTAIQEASLMINHPEPQTVSTPELGLPTSTENEIKRRSTKSTSARKPRTALAQRALLTVTQLPAVVENPVQPERIESAEIVTSEPVAASEFVAPTEPVAAAEEIAPTTPVVQTDSAAAPEIVQIETKPEPLVTRSPERLPTSVDIRKDPEKAKEPPVKSTFSIIRSPLKAVGGDVIILDIGTNSTLGTVNGCDITREQTFILYDERDKDFKFGTDVFTAWASTNTDQKWFLPMENGIINNNHIMSEYLKWFVNQMKHQSRFKLGRSPTVIVSAHTDISKNHLKLLVDCIRLALRPRKIWVVDQAMAAAIGAGIDVYSHKGAIIVDGGAGTILLAIIANLGFIDKCRKYIPEGGMALNKALMRAIKNTYHMEIGPRDAMELKEYLGTAIEPTGDFAKETHTIYGTGGPSKMDVDRMFVYRGLLPVIKEITSTIGEVMDAAPPQLRHMIHEEGCVMTGGTRCFTACQRALPWTTMA